VADSPWLWQSRLPNSFALTRPGGLVADSIDIKLGSGWWIRHLEARSGRRVIQIYDTSWDLVAFVASTTRPMISIDSAWRGYRLDDQGEPRWWTLAIGHAHSEPGLVVTFSSRSSTGQLLRVTVGASVIGGLWVAAIPGRQSSVSLRQGPHWRIRRISPTYRGRP
jgi:hypothetical protein